MHLNKIWKSLRATAVRVITTTRPLWEPPLKEIKKTWKTVNMILMFGYAIVCYLSAPAFELIPFKYGISSLMGFVICFSLFIKFTWMDESDGRR